MKYIRKLLIKNKFLYAFVKFLYVNLNPIIIKRRYINYQLGKFLDALLRDLENIKFIQVGSNDGIQNDPLRKYILNKDTWSGLLIEPVPNIFLNLEKLSLVSQRWEKILLNRILIYFRSVLQFPQQG